MEIEVLKKEIEKTGYLSDPKVGMFFNRKYPELLNQLLKITNSLDGSYYVNKYLRARLVFLFKYNLDINKIKNNGKWLTFDRKKDDFIDRTGDYRKASWSKAKSAISNEVYNKLDTINILTKNDYYKSFLGKAKNRTLLNENSKLYNSIYYHTRFMDDFNKNHNKFSIRLLTLVNHNGDENDIKCLKCKNSFTSFNYEIMDFNKLCHNCFHHNNENKYPQKGWFKEKYGKAWSLEYEKYLTEKSKFLQNSNGTSKISQNIFWQIFNYLSENQKKECYFEELNDEYFINTGDNFYFVDFKCGNKIIEFDGVYWHKNTKEKDDRRNEDYRKLGYNLLIINENDLNDKRNKITNELITKCVSFIKNEN
jgi:hypothetical protein